MSSTCRLLCLIATGFFLCIWEVPTGSLGMPSKRVENERHVVGEVETDGDKGKRREAEGGEVTESSDYEKEDCFPSDREKQGDYRRYYANDSFIGRRVPCTRDEKICLRHSLIFNPTTDRCEPLGHTCDGLETKTLIVDRMELEHGSGHVVGHCTQNEKTCSGYRMAYDGVCYPYDTVYNVICRCGISRHILGGVECHVEPGTPSSVQQPEEDGSCVIPDHENGIESRLPIDPYRQGYWNELKCSSDQATCFSQEKVFVLGYDGCHTLSHQGPCAEDHVVALDLQAANQERAEGTCVDVRGGCPKGYKRMTIDNECHEDREINLVAGKEIVFDPFGRYFSATNPSIIFRPAFDGNQSCLLKAKPSIQPPASPIRPPSPPCGADDSGECNRYEVESDSSKPEFDRK